MLRTGLAAVVVPGCVGIAAWMACKANTTLAAAVNAGLHAAWETLYNTQQYIQPGDAFIGSEEVESETIPGSESQASSLSVDGTVFEDLLYEVASERDDALMQLQEQTAEVTQLREENLILREILSEQEAHLGVVCHRLACLEANCSALESVLLECSPTPSMDLQEGVISDEEDLHVQLATQQDPTSPFAAASRRKLGVASSSSSALNHPIKRTTTPTMNQLTSCLAMA